MEGKVSIVPIIQEQEHVLTTKVRRPSGLPDRSWLSPSDAVGLVLVPSPPLLPLPSEVRARTTLVALCRDEVGLAARLRKIAKEPMGLC